MDISNAALNKRHVLYVFTLINDYSDANTLL